jgi:uncharacterized protein DUF3616
MMDMHMARATTGEVPDGLRCPRSSPALPHFRTFWPAVADGKAPTEERIVSNAFLLGRLLLRFDPTLPDVPRQLSAVTITPDGNLWVASDEGQTIERLSPIGPGGFAQHRSLPIGDFIELFAPDGEVDLEGLDYDGGYLWFTGSHSTKRKKPKGKKRRKDLVRLGTVVTEPNRYLLGRIPVVDGTLPTGNPHPHPAEQRLTAAALHRVGTGNVLVEALRTDEHLGPFLAAPLPAKENGFDIEGLAVQGDHAFLGFRGPVLGRWAVVLELALASDEHHGLSLQPIGPKRQPYIKHFVDLNGLGVRDLCLHGDDLLMLAGPTMELAGDMQVFRLKDVRRRSGDMLWRQEVGDLEVLFTLPARHGADQAEGLALFPWEGHDDCVLIVYDNPDSIRIPDPASLFVDVFRLP